MAGSIVLDEREEVLVPGSDLLFCVKFSLLKIEAVVQLRKLLIHFLFQVLYQILEVTEVF